MTNRLAGKLALVTGASRGLGAAVAKRYAAEGAQLVLLARDGAKLEALDDELRAMGAAATLVPLDLRDFEKIDGMAAALGERFGRLDILAAGAGTLGHLAPVGHFDPALVQEIMDVNFTANWRLIRALDPLLRASSAGRAIFATCAAARAAEPYWGPFAASKAALEALVKSYAAEIAQSTVRANLVDPGPLRTALRFAAFPFEDRTKIKPPEDATEAFVALAEASSTRNGEIVTP
ncbi:MAG TPA: SDR family NAD(P)-dependent oxidoreductase [Stellaceae bacterium]|jgi:NAD(P)-dependent dehydrogenase (short-subunit alcohol dehydrogenase family)